MQSPLSMQEDAHLREASGPSPERTRSRTPEITSVGEASAILAGPTLGQASTHLPHLTQASSMSPTRSFSAASKLISVMGHSPMIAVPSGFRDQRYLHRGYHVPQDRTRIKLLSEQFASHGRWRFFSGNRSMARHSKARVNSDCKSARRDVKP